MSTSTAPPPDLTVCWRSGPTGTVITVRGELDLATAPSFRAAVAELVAVTNGGTVVLELSELRFCDLAGLRSVLALKQCARIRRRGLCLHGESAVRLVATAAGLAPHLDAE